MTKQKYQCGYCNYKFEKDVSTSDGGKHNKASTQVRCPNCTNFSKTYPDKK